MKGKNQASEKIDIRILRMLGLTDVFDLDYSTYVTLLKEHLVKITAFNKKVPVEEFNLLKTELKKVKGKKGRFTVKKNNISPDKITSIKSIKVDNKKPLLLTGKVFLNDGNNNSQQQNIKESKDDKKDTLKSLIVDIKKSLNSIHKTLSNQFKFDKDVNEKRRIEEENQGRGKKESKLESLGKGIKSIVNTTKKLLSPFQNILDRIFKFLFFVFLGRTFTKFMSWIGDPKNRKKLEALGRFLKTFWPAIAAAAFLFLTPFGGFIRKTIGLLVSSVPKLLKIITRIKKFGLKDLFKRKGGLFNRGCGCDGGPGGSKRNRPKRGPRITRSMNSGGYINSYDGGGKISNSSGVSVSGAGRDNKLISANPGDVIVTPEDQKNISSQIGGDINTAIKGPSKQKGGGEQSIVVRPGERKLTPDDQQKLYDKTGFDVAEYVSDRKPKFVDSDNLKIAGQSQAASLGGIIQGFANGGIVGQTGDRKDTKQTAPSEGTSKIKETEVGSKKPNEKNLGNAAILSSAKKAVSEGKQGPATPPCASWVRMVLGMAGHPSAKKTTKKGDLDPEKKTWGKDMAASFAGTDMGQVINSQGSLQGGDVVLQKNTFGNYPTGAITHVSIASDSSGKILHQSTTGGAPKESGIFNFAYGIRLPGSGITASSLEQSSDQNQSGSGNKTGDKKNFKDNLMIKLGLGALFGLTESTGDKSNGEKETGDAPEVGKIAPGPTHQKGSNIAKELMRLLSIKDFQAAGIVGNLIQESSLVPDRVQGSGIKKGPLKLDGKTGYSYPQWTSIDRQKNFAKYMESKGFDWKNKGATDEMATGFLAQEFKGYMSNVFKNTKDVASASNWVLFNYEKPADQGKSEQKERATDAAAVLSKMGGSVDPKKEEKDKSGDPPTNNKNSKSSDSQQTQGSSNIIQISSPDTGSGWTVKGLKDSQGRPAVFSKGGAEAFEKMMKDSGGTVKGSDIASSKRSPEKNSAVGGVKNSNHLGGNALDIHGGSQSWMRKDGAKYGWKINDYPGSHGGHFDYKGKGANVGSDLSTESGSSASGGSGGGGFLNFKDRIMKLLGLGALFGLNGSNDDKDNKDDKSGTDPSTNSETSSYQAIDWKKDPQFGEAVNKVAKHFNIRANDLMGLMASESGLNPKANNGSHVGLIQFSSSSAASAGTSQSALLKMNRAQQMPYVQKYLENVGLPSGATAGHLYTAVFLPAFVKKPGNFVIAAKDGSLPNGYPESSRWYSSNKGLDMNNDGKLLITELGERVNKKKKEFGIPMISGGQITNITSKLGFKNPYSAADNRLLNIGGKKIAAQPGEQLFSYMIPKEAARQGAGDSIASYANSIVAQMDPNSQASKQLGMRNKDNNHICECIQPYSSSESSANQPTILPPINQTVGGGRLPSQGGTKEVMFSPVCPAGIEERKRILDTFGVLTTA